MAGQATTIVKVQCDQASILFQDQTNYGYMGLQGTRVSSILTLGYPLDNTNTRPLPFIASDYAVCSAPITFSSDAYEFVQSTIYDYDYGNDTLVRIIYQQRQRFSVLCNIDLSPLVCEITKLEEQIHYGNCNNIEDAKNKLLKINSLFAKVIIGMWQPLSGVNVSETIERIKDIGGFTCNCYGVGSGLIAHKNAVANGLNFILNPSGDIGGNWSANGNNITLNISDIKYVLSVDSSIQDAYSWEVSNQTNQKTYTLKVNENVLAQDLVTIIQNTPDLINQLNLANNFEISVDGKCIFTSGVSNDYTITLSNVPTGTTNAILTSIQLQSSTLNLNFAFNNSNLPSLQTYLNSLGIGAFVVSGTSPRSGTVTITSTGNANVILNLNYSIGSGNYSAQILKVSTGFAKIPAQQVIQDIINAFCSLSTAEVVMSQNYQVPYIDPSGALKLFSLTPQNALDAYIADVNASLLSLISFIRANPNVSCTSVKGVFNTGASSILSTDFFMGFFNGVCSTVSPIQIARTIMALGRNDTQFMQDFCLASTICANSTSCPNILSFSYNVAGLYLNITTVTFDTIPSSPQTVTVEYKLSSAGSYTLYSTSIVVDINGNVITPVSLPVNIGDTYDVQVLGNCHSPKSGVMQTILVVNASTSIVILASNDSGTICASGVTITAYMNGSFGIGKIIYTDAALTIPLTGYTFIVYNNDIYTIDTLTGIIGANTGVSCVSGDIFIIVDSGFSGSILNVEALPSFSFSPSNFPLLPDSGLTGLHGSFSGDITIETSSSTTGCGGVVELIINGTSISTTNVIPSGTYLIPATFAAGDTVVLNFQNNC
jgi:hypothetical protein